MFDSVRTMVIQVRLGPNVCLSKLEEGKCPECRDVAQVPDGGVEEFKTNFLIN